MDKDLLIVFVKNILPGKVKTRLAEKIGEEKAIQIYRQLLKITENTIREAKSDVEICFSEFIDSELFKGSYDLSVQCGNDLGERMRNAFHRGFQKKYKNIVLIGSDLPDLQLKHITQAFKELNNSDLVFGPAEDGGYYLIGMNKMITFPFENKKWSTSDLYQKTKVELSQYEYQISELETLNDIDTYEDFKNSPLFRDSL
ncbi:MAG: TIGR04282 family arsenosugar biosynthesis glycosyltransferase [Crocinitomicaceae bacterium]|nr:TIGR04282 family arsenosugar biosynthesis glycosyltransferase [Crocinitomicaceae bacterium]